MSEQVAFWLAVEAGALALVITPLLMFGLRARRANDAKGLALRAREAALECRDLLVGPGFLWGVWYDTHRMSGDMKELVRDERDQAVATIEKSGFSLDGVTHRFELDGKRYEVVNRPSMLSTRTCLREVGSSTILLSADHSLADLTLFRGDGEDKRMSLPPVMITARYRPLRADGVEIGKLVSGIAGVQHARVLTLPAGYCSRLEQVFVFALG